MNYLYKVMMSLKLASQGYSFRKLEPAEAWLLGEPTHGEPTHGEPTHGAIDLKMAKVRPRPRAPVGLRLLVFWGASDSMSDMPSRKTVPFAALANFDGVVFNRSTFHFHK